MNLRMVMADICAREDLETGGDHQNRIILTSRYLALPIKLKIHANIKQEAKV